MQNFLASFLLLIGTVSPGSGPQQMPIDQWTPFPGDEFVVDTEANIGYLVHTDGTYTSFKVATGQRRTVHYIGKTYDATTPEHHWQALTHHIQGDRITFGKNGHFLRLYMNDGKTYTSYGIHGHAYSNVMLAREERWASMGCVIVSDELMAIIEKTYELNGDFLRVTTAYGLEALKPQLALKPL